MDTEVCVCVKKSGYAHETGGQENDSIDEADNPLIASRPGNAKLLGEGQIGAVGAGLVPALGGSSDGTERDGIPQHDGAVPFVVSLVGESGALVVRNVGRGLESVWLPRDKRGSAKQIGMLAEPIGFRELLGVGVGLFCGEALYAEGKRRSVIFPQGCGYFWMPWRAGGHAPKAYLERVLDNVEGDGFAAHRFGILGHHGTCLLIVLANDLFVVMLVGDHGLLVVRHISV